MKSITLRVTHGERQGEPILRATYRGTFDYRVKDFLEQAGQYVPVKRYRVRYTVDPNGPLLLLNGEFVRAENGRGYMACFLSWLKAPHNTRLSRKVLPW